MSIFEQYQAGVPISFPSLDLALQLIKIGVPLFSEITFTNNNPYRQASRFLNKEWLSCSDFYNGTIECSHFNSVQENPEIIIPKRNNMQKVLSLWDGILSSIS
jgi:hypothetical protein